MRPTHVHDEDANLPKRLCVRAGVISDETLKL